MNTVNRSLAYLSKLPKADLHVHLDGSLRIKTLIELAKTTKVELPSYTESGLADLLFNKTYQNLNDYLSSFIYTNAVMLKPENLERAAYELAMDADADNVCLLEVRFAPQTHISKTMPTMHASLIALSKGLDRATKEINSSERVKTGAWPPFVYGITTCCMRSFSPERDIYFAKLIKRNSFASHASLLQIAANELAETTIRAREEDGINIVGFDIAGEEENWDVRIFEPAFNRIKTHSLHATAHAGEELGPETIYDAIAILGAERIGHGLHLFDIRELSEKNHQENFIEKLIHLISTRNVAIEACPSSNLQTNPYLKGSLKNHVLPKLLKHKIPTVICTDNRLLSHTTLTREYELVASELDLAPTTMSDFALAGFSYGFFPRNEIEKSKYICHVRSVVDAILSERAQVF